MKAFLFLVVTIVIAAGAWILAPVLRAENLINDRNRTLVFDRLETLLTIVQSRARSQALENFVEEKLGLCREMTAPDPLQADPLAKVQPIADARFPFSALTELRNITLLCNFPGGGKSLLLVPTDPSHVIVRRQLGQPGNLTVLDGNVAMLTDQADFSLDLGPSRLTIRSAQAVSLTLRFQEGKAWITILKGKPDVTASHNPESTDLFMPILFFLHDDTSLLSGGKVISSKDIVELLPTGFEVLPTTPIPGAPAPAPVAVPIVPAEAPMPPPAAAPPAAPVPAPAKPAATH